MKAIELRDVTVELGGRQVVDRVEAVVAPGEWLALIGPNGAGKTTLLRAIARLVPFGGSIEIEGRSTSEMLLTPDHRSSTRESTNALAPHGPLIAARIDAPADDERKLRSCRL